MSDASILVPVISAVITVSLGGVLASFVAHYTALARADREYKLRKLEEVFLLVESIFDARHSEFLTFAVGEVEENKVETRSAKLGEEKEVELQSKVCMLVAIYFSCLRPAIAEMLKACANLNIELAKAGLRRAGKQDDQRELIAKKFEELCACHNVVKDKIVIEAEQHKKTIFGKLLSAVVDL